LKINLNISIRFIFSLFVIASTITVRAQLPTVYFNHVYAVTSLTNNNATLGSSRISGQNFKFIGDIAGANGVFATSNGQITGKFIYTTPSGSNVIYSGRIDLNGPPGSDVWGFIFEQTSGGSLIFFLTNPFFESSVTGSSTLNLNSSNILRDLNTMRNGQVVLTTNYFVSNFNTCLNTESTAQTFTVSGSNLSTSSITVTAPSNFEVSTTGSSYAPSVSFSPSGGTVATSTVYLRMKSIASTGSYSGNVVVSATNAASQTYSTTGNVNATTEISPQPVSSTICSGNATTFSLTAAGASLTYQWQVSTNGGTSYSDLSNTGIYTGATNSVLRLSSGLTSSYNTYKYRCNVTGSCGSVTSSAASLTVNSPCIIRCRKFDY